ncbi:MAG TPA: putative transporter [Bacteroidales bacterium]|nr:putative transporter [Bacteroidales bacterium]HPI68167.1 putative transporter [Bacteroidales bacterium]
MDWISDLFYDESVAHTILIYCIVISLGVMLGRIKIRGVSFGITFVLFAGIALGHFGFSADEKVVEFIKDFGLILFVYSIGLQVGPGFFSSFRRGGLTLNMLAMTVVFLGAVTTLAIHYITGTSLYMLVGVMSGAVTNTPGLGAAQQALEQIWITPDIPEISLGYAVAYPFGVLGIILTMIIIRVLFKVNTKEELDSYNKDKYPEEKMPDTISIMVTNRDLCGVAIRDIPLITGHSFVISRVLHNGELMVAGPDTIVHEKDIILVVAARAIIPEIISRAGVKSNLDLTALSGKLVSRRILVSNKNVFGKSLGSLKLRTRYHINITRVYRSGIEFLGSPEIRLQPGDRLTIVGDEGSIEKVTNELGDSVRRLDEPNLIPIFIGILLGVLLGSIPFKIPGVIHPVKLGLAGGPLIVAILLSRYGYRLQLVSYTTPSANYMIREMGIVLFLASVGITAGEKFIPSLLTGDGFIWMAYGAVITLFPVLTVGLAGRFFFRRNYLEMCGLLAGSTTDPPALAFANTITDSEAPAIAYATVYPLVMFLRIFLAQLMIVAF